MDSGRPANPFEPLLRDRGIVFLDGGLATALEARGHDLDDPLWSARLLVDRPEEIEAVHRAYLDAGADCIITAGYQATPQGFAEAGIAEPDALRLLDRSVQLGLDARDAFGGPAAGSAAGAAEGAAGSAAEGTAEGAAEGVAGSASGSAAEGTAEGTAEGVAGSASGSAVPASESRPLVAAGIGPYGAYLADGSEYTGDYDLDQPALTAFHRLRFHRLADSPADLLALETLPSLPEVRALAGLLAETDAWAWFSFSCRDSRHLRDGSTVEDAVRALTDTPRVAAIGVNCTHPRYVRELVSRIADLTDRPVLAYPNSGELYRPETKSWAAGSGGAGGAGGAGRAGEGGAGGADGAGTGWIAGAGSWVEAGARIVGGCCRVGPDAIRGLRRSLS